MTNRGTAACSAKPRAVTALNLLVFLLVATSSFAAETKRRPNVVLFIADDLGWADCSIYKRDSGIRTPNMERLGRDGMTFTHAFVASPSCAPSRAALLTGLTPFRNGAMFNHMVPDAPLKKWPAYFAEAGYETAAIGKVAHYATVRGYGFDHVSHFKYHEDDCVTAAVDWLGNRKSDKPLCLIVGTNWPHVPWPKKTEYAPGSVPLTPTQVDTPETREWRARYAQAVTDADRDLGLIYDAARKVLGEETLFLFSSDHGSQFPFGKWNCYDAGIRTPLIVAWPGKIAPGTHSDAMVSWLDILPTCLEAIGTTPPTSGTAPGQISGRSFLPVLRGEKNEHRETMFATHSGDGRMNEYPMRAVRSRDWKYIRNLAPETEHHTHVDKAQGEDGKGYWSSWEKKAESDAAAASVLARYFHRPAEELYDLKSDPWELKNLAAAAEHRETLARLRAEVDGSMKAERDGGLSSENARRPAAARKP
ncbi:MAG TPA: sulfatase [Chthoniobacteraceae bacterium]|nr:sulfatase [Chthoniobacteraceae bacterium]